LTFYSDLFTKGKKMKVPKKFGEITGKVVSSAKSLPAKTSKNAKSVKEEFIAGYKSTAV